MIEIQPVDMKLVSFVASALATGKHTTNHVMMCLYIEGQTIAATDGHRAHWATLQGEYAPGLYEVVKLNKKECILKESDAGEFPDYKRCIPAKGEEIYKHLEGVATEYAYSAAIRAEQGEATYNYSYFKDACVLSCTLKHAGHLQPSIFEGERHGALVMPMRK